MPSFEEQSFAASYDTLAKILSAVVIVSFLAIPIAARSLLLGAFELCVIALAYLYSPQSYAISGGFLLIKRLIGTVRLPLSSILELRAGTADDLRKCIRLWGSGGLLGYYGRFKTAKLGQCRWYMTNRSNSVIVVTGDRTLILSPNDVPGFLASVRRVVSVPETAEGQVARASDTSRAGFAVGLWIGAAVAILVLCVVGFALMYAPGPPNLTLTSNSLTIHDRFYPVTVNAADIDVGGIKIVNIHTDREWKPIARTDGFANAHYHSGWFQVAGGSVRMYWADGPRLIFYTTISEVIHYQRVAVLKMA